MMALPLVTMQTCAPPPLRVGLAQLPNFDHRLLKRLGAGYLVLLYFEKFCEQSPTYAQ